MSDGTNASAAVSLSIANDFACVRADAAEDFSMHKDKPPGIFDLTERSMRYAAGFCFVVGFIVSVIVRIGVVLAHEHFSQPTPWSGM